MSRKTFFVTGGAGFIGSRLCELLGKEGDVVAYDNLHPQVHAGNPDNLQRLAAHGVRLIEADIRDPAALNAAIAEINPDVIYHLAAETGTGQSFDLVARYNDVNVMGTAHLIEAIRAHGPNVRRVILAGSRSVYGEGACVDAAGRPTAAVARTDDDMRVGDYIPKDRFGTSLTPVPTDASCVVAPASVYASTKYMQELLLEQAFWGTGVGVGILRLQNVYGPGQSLNNPYTGVLSIFTRQIAEGKTLNIYEDGEITRDFVLVSDVAEAFRRIGTIETLPGQIVDIGSGEPATILDVARELLRLMGEDPARTKVTGAFRPGDIRYAVADITAAAEKLGWRPANTLAEGLAQLVDWSKATMTASGS